MSEWASGDGLPLSQYDAKARRRGAHDGNISIAFLNMSPTLTEQRERAGAHITEESDVHLVAEVDAKYIGESACASPVVPLQILLQKFHVSARDASVHAIHCKRALEQLVGTHNILRAREC